MGADEQQASGTIGRGPTAVERARGTATTWRYRSEGFVRQLPHRPAAAAGVTGVVLGPVNGALAIVAAVTVGIVLLNRRGGFTLPLWGPDVPRRTLPIIGRVLVGLFFVLPVASAGLVLPGFRNPSTIDKYVSILIAEPSGLFQTVTPFPYPGIPLVVVVAIALVAFGLWRPRRRLHLAALVGGFVLFLVSPTISAVANGTGGVQFSFGQYAMGMWLGLLGAGLLVTARVLTGRADAVDEAEVLVVPPMPTPVVTPPRAADPPPERHALSVSLLLAGLGGAVPLAFLGIPFEALHHGIAALLAGLVGGGIGYSTTEQEEEVEDAKVFLALQFPAGYSSTVFTTGWTFGAKCLLHPGTDDEVDVSDQVAWSGSGAFSPPLGRSSRPSFAAEGANTITLTWEGVGGRRTRDFSVNAVSPAGFSHVGSQAQVAADAHGCPACPHPAVGPVVSGSPNVFVNGKPAARKGDVGVHAACCGPNTFRITGGNGQVLINGRPAATVASTTAHCGGTGELIS